jgi:hypothetical protein
MARWEYCKVIYTAVREGTGGVDEMLAIHLPDGTARNERGTGNGMVTVLNELGADGWEVFNLTDRAAWLKRERI